MKIFVLLLCLAVPAVAQETVRALELPPATMSEMAAVPLRQQAPRVIEQRWLPPLRSWTATHAAAVLAPASTTAPPPAFVFPSDSSIELSPADAGGAVGPRHVVGAYNTGVFVHDRSGALLKKVTLAQFWFSNAAPGAFYDPRIVYDDRADRWIVMSILDERSVMLAISEGGDPAGAWRRYQIDERYADFSHLVLTADSIVAATMYWPTEHHIFFVVSRAEAYANPQTLTARRIATPDEVATPVASDSGDELVIMADTYTIRWRPVDGSAPWQWAEMPRFWDYPDPKLPQLGGQPLDGSSGYIENAVERNGWIHAVLTRGRAWNNSILWCRIHRATGKAEWGAITDPAYASSYSYPSLAVNRSGGMLIGFGIFSPSHYASSGYVYRSPFGTTSSIAGIGSGDTAVTVGKRWGDYTTTVVDPLDDHSFWTVQAHAKKGRFWETAWAKVEPPGGRRRAARH